MNTDELQEKAYVLAQQVLAIAGIEAPEHRHYARLLEAVTECILSDLQAVKSEAVEQCCAGVCHLCDDGVPVYELDGTWWHDKERLSHSDDWRVMCQANAIRVCGKENGND